MSWSELGILWNYFCHKHFLHCIVFFSIGWFELKGLCIALEFCLVIDMRIGSNWRQHKTLFHNEKVSPPLWHRLNVKRPIVERDHCESYIIIMGLLFPKASLCGHLLWEELEACMSLETSELCSCNLYLNISYFKLLLSIDWA